MTGTIPVLVVEDEPVAAAAHAAYVHRVPGFTVAGTAHTLAAARSLLTDGRTRVGLILLDLNLPDGHGLDLVRALRAAGQLAPVIAVTSARDLAVVRAAVSLGVGQYLLKPFTFAGLRAKLLQHAEFERRARAAEPVAGQGDVDRLLGVLRTQDQVLPKGIDAATLAAVTDALRAEPAGRSAAEVAAVIGTSRVTARRYLEHLADSAGVQRAPRYGLPGRPEVAYRLVGSGPA